MSGNGMNSAGISNIDGTNTIRALEYAKRISYSTEETLMFTYEMAKKYADSPGCYVEAGVAAGAQIIAMAAGAPKTKRIYALDSFQGIPLPSNRDDQMPGIAMLTEAERKALPDPGKQELVSSGATAVKESDFWKHIHDSGVWSGNIVSIKGWFEKTANEFASVGEPIAILRLDGDLYNSTRVCLEGLHHLVISGGIIIIDDWQLPGCQDAVKDYIGKRRIASSRHNAMTYVPEIQFVSNIAYWIKP